MHNTRVYGLEKLLRDVFFQVCGTLGTACARRNISCSQMWTMWGNGCDNFTSGELEVQAYSRFRSRHWAVVIGTWKSTWKVAVWPFFGRHGHNFGPTDLKFWQMRDLPLWPNFDLIHDFLKRRLVPLKSERVAVPCFGSSALNFRVTELALAFLWPAQLGLEIPGEKCLMRMSGIQDLSNCLSVRLGI